MQPGSHDNWRFEGLAPTIVRGGLVVGAIGLALSLLLGLLGGMDRFYQAYLVSFCFYLSLGLGALFFVLIQHLTGATWSVVVRRLAEAVAANLPLLGLLIVPILIGLSSLYPWADAQKVASDPLLQHKRAYLNVPFFLVRLVLYFGIWTLLSRFFLRRSLEQDQSGEIGLTLKMEKGSAGATVLFAITLSFAAVDLLMSIEPHWYSTIFGVYYFAGSALSFFALLPILILGLRRAGLLQRTITPEHLHDLGKLVFAFTVFWAYIAFSQYMLIWYANIPEETFWIKKRQSGPWTAGALLLLFGHFLVPFFFLLPRTVKKHLGLLSLAAGWMLLMHWFDLYWLAMPAFSPEKLPVHLLDLTCFVGLGGIFFAAAAHRLRDRSLVPLRDPRLQESLAFENI